MKGDILDESDSMRILRQLDEGTDWEQSGDMLVPDTDEDDTDDGMAGVSTIPHLHSIDGGAEDSLGGPETATNILNTARDMYKNGVVEDILIIVNTKDGEQHLMTTLDRNDHIIGMLSVATMNWHSSQIASINFYDEEEEV